MRRRLKPFTLRTKHYRGGLKAKQILETSTNEDAEDGLYEWIEITTHTPQHRPGSMMGLKT
jgi:hypothetical protein